MLYTSSPIINNPFNSNEKINSKPNKSEININPNKITSKNNNINTIDSNSIQIVNPFDSISSKKQQIQFQSFSNNSNRVNNRYSQISNSISLSNSHANKENSNNYYKSRNGYNDNLYSLSSNMTNKEMKTNNSLLTDNSKKEKSIIENSKDLNFEIINNDEISDYKNSKNFYSSSNSNYSINNNNGNNIRKNEEFNVIKESDEEECNETSQTFLRAINLKDIESYVNKFRNIFDIKKYNSNINKYEIIKRISDIINSSPFDNINISMNQNGEVNIDKLLTVTNIVNIKNLNNKQITEQFNKDFYEQILSAKNFSDINIDLHNDTNFDCSLISVSMLHTYNGQNKILLNKQARDIISNNGNSFLKAFVFNYFENLITGSYYENIIFMIYIVSVKLPSLNLSDINLKEVLTILKIIFTHIEKKNINEAFIVLINAFKENSFFEKGLIYFVKYCLKQFITDNYALFDTDYLSEIISDKYVNNLNNQFNYQNYISEKIMIPQDESQYELLLYYLLPLIFPIKLVIYTDSNAKVNKLIFKNRLNNNTFNVELNVKFGNTSIIYNDIYYNKYKNIIPYKNDFNYPVDKIKKISNNNTDNSKNVLCKECNSNPENFIQVGPQIKPVCEKCLINSIDKVIQKRFLYLQEDSFFHEEFYCSKIKLTNALENNLYLSLNDIKILLPNHNGISDEIRKIVINNKICDICNQVFKSSKYTICFRPCGHIICDNCFIKYVNDITHKRIILNHFEIETEKFEYICPSPSCENNRIQNVEYFIYKYINKVDDYVKKAKDRFESQVKNFCCICKKVSNRYTFDIEINNRKLKHTICTECKKKMDIQKNNNVKRSHQTNFMCYFCNQNHIYNLLVIDRNRNKDKNESCCAIF